MACLSVLLALLRLSGQADKAIAHLTKPLVTNPRPFARTWRPPGLRCVTAEGAWQFEVEPIPGNIVA